MIGGTGLLGSEAAKVLIERGHEVVSIALPPLPKGAVLPEKMKIEFGNYLEMSDDELREKLAGCEGFVFAAGVDERSKVHHRSMTCIKSTISIRSKDCLVYARNAA